ncbi:hypothetical protein [Nonomuraea sp. NPDC050783]|uniref:hypothetical protein n=1 Tax=Nonomuraea sp. NPDC050783 TaxID=3154634 RepID=UPI003466EEC7
MLGAGAGLLATPLVAAGFMFGDTQLRTAPDWPPDWPPVAALAGAAILVGVLAGSRLSPLASLLPGLALLALATAALARLDVGYTRVPAAYLDDYRTLVTLWAPVAGCVLLAASAFPSRWRGGPRAAPVAAEPAPPQPEEQAPAPPPLPKRIPSRY